MNTHTRLPDDAWASEQVQAAGFIERQARQCSVEGCKAPLHCRGLCRSHYMRLRRHGDTASRQAPAGAGWEFIKSSLLSDTDDCLIWPYGVRDDGYGQAHFLDKPISASRLIAILAHGTPEDGMHAAHGCNQRLCCNPRHLRWATPAENLSDRRANGTHPSGEQNPAAKITAETVSRIKADFKAGVSRDEICRTAGISRTQMYRIVKNKSWTEIINDEAERKSSDAA